MSDSPNLENSLKTLKIEENESTIENNTNSPSNKIDDAQKHDETESNNNGMLLFLFDI